LVFIHQNVTEFEGDRLIFLKLKLKGFDLVGGLGYLSSQIAVVGGFCVRLVLLCV